MPPSAPSAAVQLNGVVVRYDAAPVVRDLNWQVAEGDHWLLLGPSGSGKTTILHLIAGLLLPESGSVSVLGRDLSSLSPSARDSFRGRMIAIVFQRQHLVSALTVEENLRLARSLAGLPPNTTRLNNTLERLGIAALRGRKPHRLSGGEAQRAALARALAVEPRIMLADEPTASLDDRNAVHAVELLRREATALGAALIVATHDHRIRDRFPNRLPLGDAES